MLATQKAAKAPVGDPESLESSDLQRLGCRSPCWKPASGQGKVRATRIDAVCIQPDGDDTPPDENEATLPPATVYALRSARVGLRCNLDFTCASDRHSRACGHQCHEATRHQSLEPREEKSQLIYIPSVVTKYRESDGNCQPKDQSILREYKFRP
jgi:hypothetical protein